MAVHASNNDDLKAEINITPLVDVVLVLLVIFMVVTPLLKQEVPIDLPLAANSRNADDAAQVTVSLSADGRTLVNGVEMPAEQVLTNLAAMYADRPDKTIFLEADRALPHGRIVDLMDDCRAAGIQRIGVITKREEGSSVPPRAPPAVAPPSEPAPAIPAVPPQ